MLPHHSSQSPLHISAKLRSLRHPLPYISGRSGQPRIMPSLPVQQYIRPTGAEPPIPSYLHIIRSQVWEIPPHVHRQVLLCIHHQCHQLRNKQHACCDCGPPDILHHDLGRVTLNHKIEIAAKHKKLSWLQ